MTESEPARERRSEILDILDTEAYWGISNRTCHDIGRMGCHDIPTSPRLDRSPKPGEPYYVVSLDTKTGDITTTHFDGEGNEIISD
jgi:hypothetical protein